MMITEKKSMEQNAKSVALKFVEVINAGNSKTLIELQSEDFTLIDMDGDVSCGRDGWEGYVISVMSSIAVLVKYAKLHHMVKKETLRNGDRS